MMNLNLTKTKGAVPYMGLIVVRLGFVNKPE
jgi:hypothetical protein